MPDTIAVVRRFYAAFAADDMAEFDAVLAPDWRLASYRQLAAVCGSCTQFFSTPKQQPQALIGDPHLGADIYGKSLLHPISTGALKGFQAFLATPARRAVVTSIGAQMPIIAKHLAHVTVMDVGPGYHYLAEDAPAGIARALLAWHPHA